MHYDLTLDIKKFINYTNKGEDYNPHKPYGGLSIHAPKEAREVYDKVCKRDAERKAKGIK